MSKKRQKKNSNQDEDLKIKKIEIDEDFFEDNKEKKKDKHFFVNLFLVLVAISSLGYFITCLFFDDDTNSLQTLVESLLLVLFSLVYVIVSITSNRRKRKTILLSSILLLSYFVLKIGITFEFISFPSTLQVENFTGKSLTEVISWAEKNNVEIQQEYEYSDMIEEYLIISQDVEAGTKMKDVKKLTIAVSDGPNPSKEIVVPNMVSWDSTRVLEFVKDNYLSNVIVEFVQSDKAKDTVIEQSKSGNLRRDEELKLTFSYGEELGYDEVKLIDFTGMSKFEVEFYLKQHQLRYEFDNDFSKKIKRGYALRQDKKAGEMIKINDEKIKVTFSKGPEIKVPDLKDMSTSEITEWVIKNKLKLEFTDKYDDTVLDNEVISASHEKGDVVEQGETIKIVLSKGSLKMPKFESLSEFRDWADKYEIKYEEKYEFSDDIEAGQVISYSYKTGEVIKNDDSIVVTISDGKKLEVPNLKGLKKSEIISKLKKIGLNYNFVYKSSSSVSKDNAISQSISAGSEVSKGTTITITLSNGKEAVKNREESSSSNSSSSSSSNNNNSTTTPATPTCEEKTYEVGRGLLNIFNSYSGYDSVKSALYSHFSSNYPNVKISVVGEADTGMSSGSYVGGIGPGSKITSCNETAYTIKIAK